jgi:hypothetical protein
MKFPDTAPATITLAYKSGQTHIHETSVSDARKRAETAIRRKSIKWIRVSIPLPSPATSQPREARFFYSTKTKWEQSTVVLPRTKD